MASTNERDNMSELISDAEYVSRKLKSKHFKYGVIREATGISRYQIRKAERCEPVKPFVIIALNDYFRKLGE